MTEAARRPGDALVAAVALFLVTASLSVDPALLRRGAPLTGETEAVAAALSFGRDRDLSFDRDDLGDSAAAFGAVPERIELVRPPGGGSLRYPRVGPDAIVGGLAARVVGASRTLPLVHATALALGLWIAWRRLGDGSALSAGWLVTLVMASPWPIQIFRFTGEATAAAAALAGLALVARGPLAVRALGGVALGIAAIAQLGVTPAGELLVFTDALPRGDGSGAEAGRALLSPDGGLPAASVAARAIVELWTGRFGGLLWTFPTLLVALPLVVASRSPWRIAAVATYAVGLSAMAALSPHAFAGGPDAFGVLPALAPFALVVVAASGLARPGHLLAAWLLAALFVVEPLGAPLEALRDPGQHARDLPYTWLPPERGRAGELPAAASFDVDARDRLRLQYLNGNAFRPSGDCRNFDPQPPLCLWTADDEPADMLLWSRVPLGEVELALRAGPGGGRARVALDADAAEVAVSEEPTRLTLRAGEGVRTVHDGAAWRVHRLRVQASRGFQPRLEGVSGDVRWLGIEVGLDAGLDDAVTEEGET